MNVTQNSVPFFISRAYICSIVPSTPEIPGTGFLRQDIIAQIVGSARSYGVTRVLPWSINIFTQ